MLLGASLRCAVRAALKPAVAVNGHPLGACASPVACARRRPRWRLTTKTVTAITQRIRRGIGSYSAVGIDCHLSKDQISIVPITP